MVHSLFILLIDVGTFTQQQLSHLLPLGVRGGDGTVLKYKDNRLLCWCQSNRQLIVSLSDRTELENSLLIHQGNFVSLLTQTKETRKYSHKRSWNQRI